MSANHRALAGRNRQMNVFAAFLHRPRDRHNFEMTRVDVRLGLVRITLEDLAIEFLGLRRIRFLQCSRLMGRALGLARNDAVQEIAKLVLW